MPNSLNAKKRHRQNLVRRGRNRIVRSQVRKSLRALESVLKEGQKEAANEKFQLFAKLIDSAVGKGVYHVNTAARKKSRMQKRLHVLA